MWLSPLDQRAIGPVALELSRHYALARAGIELQLIMQVRQPAESVVAALTDPVASGDVLTYPHRHRSGT